MTNCWKLSATTSTAKCRRRSPLSAPSPLRATRSPPLPQGATSKLKERPSMIRKLFIATLLLCGIASAQPPQPGSGMGFGGAHERFGHGMKAGGGVHGMLPPGRWWKDAEVSKAIGLNDGQVQKIEQIFQESRV